MREEMIEQYRGCLRLFCTESAFLEELKGKIENGVVSDEEIAPHLSFMEEVKNDLLDLKKKLGFEGELDFMNDVKFLGFQFKDGSLSGDYENLIPIVSNFIEEFDEENVYQYEVGTLILFHYMRQMGIDKGISFNEEKKKKKSGRKKIGFFARLLKKGRRN